MKHCCAHCFTSCLSLKHAYTQAEEHALSLFYLKEKPWCLKSFGVLFELNKSADLPLRQRMSNREH